MEAQRLTIAKGHLRVRGHIFCQGEQKVKWAGTDTPLVGQLHSSTRGPKWLGSSVPSWLGFSLNSVAHSCAEHVGAVIRKA